jgi:hypothetical protein
MLTARDQFAIDTTVFNMYEINAIAGTYGNPGVALALQVSFSSRPEALISLDRKMHIQAEQMRREHPSVELPSIWLIPLLEEVDSVKNIRSYLDRVWNYATQSRQTTQLVQERFATVLPTLPTWAAPPVMMPPVSTTGRFMKIGLSSSATTVAHTASMDEPPLARIARPASTALPRPATASSSEPGRHLPAPPCAMSAIGIRVSSGHVRLAKPDVQLAQLALGDGARRFHHHVLPALRLGERDHVADLVDSCHQRDHAVETEGDASVRGCAVGERIEQEPEFRARIFIREDRKSVG